MEGKKHVVAVSSEDKVDVKKQKLDVVMPSREERLEMYMSTFKNRKMLEEDDKRRKVKPDGTHPMTFRDFASFELDMLETDGFDVQDYTKVNDAGMIRTIYDPEAGFGEKFLDEITDCARDAIMQFNTDNGKRFVVDRVIKANVEPVCPYRYYITFEAHDATERIVEDFQAKVDIHIPITEREVTLVRIRQPPRLFSLDDMTVSTMFHCCC